MGLSGGSKSTSGSAQKWATPYAKAAASDVQDVYNTNQSTAQSTANTITSLVPSIASSYSSQSGVADQASDYLSNVLSGQYLDPTSNTALQSVVNTAGRNAANAVNSNYSLAGRYGSNSHDSALAQGVADATGSLLYDAYNTERGYQNDAATTAASQQSNTLAQLLQAATTGTELPYTGTTSLASALSSLMSGGTSKTSGGLLSGIGSLASGIGTLKL